MGASLEDEVYTVYILEEAFMDWDRVIYNGTVVFVSRVGFGAGFSKNADNQHTGQIVCFDDKNS